MAGTFHTLYYPVTLGAWRSGFMLPAMAPGARRTYVLELSAFCDDVGTTISGVNPVVDGTLQFSFVAVEVGDKTITFEVSGGDLSVPEPVIYLPVIFDNGDIEKITITQLVEALSPPAPNGTGAGSPLTVAFHPVDLSTLALLPGGAQSGDQVLALRNGTAGLVPAGSGGGGESGYASFTAIATISGHRALMVAPGGVAHADPSGPFAFAGISTQAASAGSPILVAEDGQTITEPSWAWTLGAPLYVGPGGALTATPPLSGVLQQVAVATAPTAILVQAFAPVIRN